MKNDRDPTTVLAALGRCAAAMAAPGQPDPLFRSLETELGQLIGHKLFTIMVLDYERGVAQRLYTSAPEAYPVQGRKPLRDLTDWGKQVIEAKQAFMGLTREVIRQTFSDHETIEALGCGAIINLPVRYDDRVLGAVNILHEENHFTDADIEVGTPFAQLAATACRDWAAALSR